MKKAAELQRKSPKQGRSREMVDAIFQATVRILPKLGADNLTTKRIADVAGISVGSLYQYFPNKESVLGAVMDASVSVINATLNSRFSTISEMSLDDAIQFTVDTALEILLNDRPQIREVFRLTNELGRLPMILASRRVSVELLAKEIHRRYSHIPLRECERMTFVAVNSLMGVILTMLYDETQTWTREELAREAGEMFRLYVHTKISQSNELTKKATPGSACAKPGG